MRTMQIAAVCLVVSACGASTAETTARHVLVTAGQIVQSVDEANAALMQQSREYDLQESDTRPQFNVLRAPYWRVTDAVMAARAALYAAETILDLVGAEGFAQIVSCVVQALTQLETALVALGSATGVALELPQVGELLATVGGFTGECRSALEE